MENTKQEDFIFKLLHIALLEIRIEAHESHKKIFHLADLFHNIPLQILNARKDDKKYTEILNWIQKRAEEKGCAEWLDSLCRKNLKKTIKEVKSKH